MRLRYLLMMNLLMSLTLQGCSNTLLSSRTTILSNELEEDIQEFDIVKIVELQLEHSDNSQLDKLVFLIYLNHSNERILIYKGTKKKLENSKIPIPKSQESDSKYFISVQGVDQTHKIIYKWSSDVTYSLSDTNINTIQLIYTNIVDESITLRVL